MDPVEAYFGALSERSRAKLEELRRIAKAAAPEAAEKMAYGIPTLHLLGNLVHYGGWEGHVGFYPGADAVAAFAPELERYGPSKGTVRFPLDEPIPEDLVRRIVEFRLAANRAKAAAKKAGRRKG